MCILESFVWRRQSICRRALRYMGQICRTADEHALKMSRGAKGNADPLLFHSKILVEAARRLGVTVDALFFPDDYTPPLQHEYEFDLDAEAGKIALQRSLKFVADHTR
jgi:hypothetical protein